MATAWSSTYLATEVQSDHIPKLSIQSVFRAPAIAIIRIALILVITIR